jgi:putative Ca2+/H+ antiporter (TMEM165/GDT1 family)
MLCAMSGFVVAALSAFGVVFVAELGDKTQLLALGFGARYSLRTVSIGLTLGYAAAGAVAATVGGVLGATLPERPVAVAGGLLFLVFAMMALLGDEGEDVDPDDGSSARIVRTRNVIASIAFTIAVAEMGDKTQLATATLAARGHPVGTWLGATGGEVAAGMIGAVAGQKIGARLDPRKLQLASAVLFAVFGIVLLTTAW